MPVPVDAVRPAPVSKAKIDLADIVRDDALTNSSPTPGKTRKRKWKAKGAEQVAELPDTVEAEPWSWKSLTESSASKIPPVFTEDGSYFFAVCGSSVKIFSVATSQVVSTLDASYIGESAAMGSSSASHAVTAAIINPHNPFQLLTGSHDGCLRIWDFLDAVLLQTINVKRPILYVAAHQNFKEHVFVAVERQGIKKTKGGRETEEHYSEVLRVSLQPTDETAGLSVQTSSKILQVGVMRRQATGLALSHSGAWLVATGGHTVYVCATSNLKGGFTKFVSPEHLTCFTFHPSEEYFATGDAIGCVRLWYCLNAGAMVKATGVKRTPQTTMMHWHAHAVSSIAFTPNGAYLLSGGEEAALVIWVLHSGQKEIVPRVGAPIVHVTSSKSGDREEEYLLSLADASFVFVRSSNLRISRSIARIKLDPATGHARPSIHDPVPLALHHPTSSLLLPSSHPSVLQIFSPSSSKLLSEIEVSPSNRVSRTDEKPLEPPRVEQAAISDSGEWMVTVDRRERGDAFHAEMHLKVWSWDPKSQSWLLNTRIHRPHGADKVTAVAFRPGARSADSLLLVTTGEDGNVKTWRIRSAKSKSGAIEEFWVARSTLRFRSEIPRHVSWSPDGSLFAVAMGTHICLYDEVTNSLEQVVTCTECGQISSAHFIGPNGRYIAAVGPRDLMLWDVVLSTSCWHYRSPSIIERLVAHTTNESFAVFEQLPSISTEPPSTKVLLFRPAWPYPSVSRTLPFRLRAAIMFPSLSGPSTMSSFTLVGVTDSWHVVLFGDDVRLPEEQGSTARAIDEDPSAGKRTLFQDIFGKSAFVNLNAENATSAASALYLQPWRGKEIAEVFDAPAHLMPPLGSIFDSLLDSFLTARPANAISSESEEHERDDEDEDAEMDVVENATSNLITVDTRIDREVDQKEMDTFVELFKHYAVQAPIPSQQTQPRTNGVHKTDGISKPHTNGTSHASHAIPAVTPAHIQVNDTTKKSQAPAPDPADASLVETSPVITGKKRKKSLG
ncbi:WD40 repeat-like protein [Laetiporus sulphureus 93-53]|uniref:WD40 repeat-like protein n=1 Tax=Laetiporus sulphureus 93-53 TaxID=1314785 RepID=A0A165C9B2_9APHY|nr:WD40 repeat-like protein [Laetiporus sulphureus 93-53]KZT02424.1 WD40 repeat-like protein [Laetiporus sulphureus 93-53]